MPCIVQLSVRILENRIPPTPAKGTVDVRATDPRKCGFEHQSARNPVILSNRMTAQRFLHSPIRFERRTSLFCAELWFRVRVLRSKVGSLARVHRLVPWNYRASPYTAGPCVMPVL